MVEAMWHSLTSVWLFDNKSSVQILVYIYYNIIWANVFQHQNTETYLYLHQYYVRQSSFALNGSWKHSKRIAGWCKPFLSFVSTYKSLARKILWVPGHVKNIFGMQPLFIRGHWPLNANSLEIHTKTIRARSQNILTGDLFVCYLKLNRFYNDKWHNMPIYLFREM